MRLGPIGLGRRSNRHTHLDLDLKLDGSALERATKIGSDSSRGTDRRPPCQVRRHRR